MNEATVLPSSLSAIAFTQGPGLIGSLMVGSSFAKGLALALQVPLIAVHHLEAHPHAVFVCEKNDAGGKLTPRFPFLCLTVSGGHTQVLMVKDFLEMEILGETLDDAAGEAFDKTAKMLGLPYPGGPIIDRLSHGGDPEKFHFPEPSVPGLHFSFSGLKTAILYFLRDHQKKDPDFISQNLADICASVQQRIVQILLDKLKLATKMTGIREVVLAGGVSANSGLRSRSQIYAEQNHWNLFIPDIRFCTDNAAMIALAAHHKYLAGAFAPQSVAPSASMDFRDGIFEKRKAGVK